MSGEWTVKAEEGEGTTREGGTAMVQAKDDGDWAQGVAKQVGRSPWSRLPDSC